MKKEIKKLPPFDVKTGCVNVIVETPKSSQIKYAYDTKSGLFEISKAMPEGMIFPFNFGFVPQTLAADGDPIDVLILNEETLFSGCRLRVKAIAVIKAKQSQKNGDKPIRNDRIVGKALPKETTDEFETIKLEKHLLDNIEKFFINYNKAVGKHFEILGIGNSKEAKLLIKAAAKTFSQKRKKRVARD